MKLLIGVFLVSLFVLCEADTINVHVVAHTHDDVGWLKTVDEYYYGANTSIQDAGVQYILDTVVDALLADESKKFIYVEIAFFIRWWREQSEFRKQVVRDLVASGRFEFINGGWCMNDEGNTHYSAIIEQMTRGHEFLFNEFGVRPRIGWHIDPFGHASTQASLFAQMGFDAFFFGRIDFSEHVVRNASKTLEFVWRGSNSLGQETQIWSHVLFSDYCFLNGFAWDYGDTPIMDDPDLFDMNIKQKSDDYAAQIRQRSVSYRTNNILAPFGCDFAFQNAHLGFKNMDKLMKYINSHPEYGMKLFYSTPSIYLQAVHDAGLTWTVKTGDFFPYADDAHSYWSGYFSSRVALKGYVRTRNAFLHATDRLYTTASAVASSIATQANLQKIDVLTQAFSVAQHHDAVAGTEKQHVADDYAKRLAIGTAKAEEVINEAIGKLVNPTTPPTFSFCPRLNVSECDATNVLKQGQSVPIVVYNPVGWKREHWIRLPVPIQKVQVLNTTGKVVPYQMIPNSDRPGYFTLIFLVSAPPLGYSTYFVSPAQSEAPVTPIQSNDDDAADIVIENENLKVTFSSSTGRMSSIMNKNLKQTLQVNQDFMWWNASAGNNKDSQQPSGAYIFRPNGTTPFPVNSNSISISSTTGNLVSEVYQTWSSWASQVVRLYAGAHHVEVEATVGPVPIQDNLGKEVFSRFSTNLATQGLFYTDSEGMEFVQRIRNKRPWANYTITEPIASNYYPMNQAAYISDLNQKLQFTVLTDRSRGASSLADGQFENILQRRLLYDDFRGVGEPLNESAPIRTNELLLLNTPALASREHRPYALLFNNPPVLAFGATKDVKSWMTNNKITYSPMSTALPPNVHLLNLKTREDGFVILRLTHIYAAGEDHEFSRPATVDLSTIFPDLQIATITEMTLTANRPLAELHRLVWKTTDNNEGHTTEYKKIEDSNITLNPMDTKTFMIRYQPSRIAKPIPIV